MSDLLQELVGRAVQVYTVRGESEVSDTGVLDAYDDNWIRLRKENVLLLFSVSRVRLIKPL